MLNPSPKDTAVAGGWRHSRVRPSLAEVFGSIATRPTGSFWRKLTAFLGPGYLVAVGYMDPGNWATSLAGGSKFGYTLLTVALLSNLMAILLQALCARLGIGAGRDLAQACRDAFPRAVSWPLWVLAEIAICATDLAEVIGTAIGLNLLFGIPLEIGVLITALDVFLILWLQNLGFRWIEAFIVTLLGVITICFAVQIAICRSSNGTRLRNSSTETTRVPSGRPSKWASRSSMMAWGRSHIDPKCSHRRRFKCEAQPKLALAECGLGVFEVRDVSARANVT